MTENHPMKSNPLVTRREMLGTTGMAALTGLTGSVAGPVPQAPQTRPRIACCVSFWGAPGSHADWIICKLMDRVTGRQPCRGVSRNRIYSGDYDYKGCTYTGQYEPMVSRELWQNVQDVLDRRHRARPKKNTHEFAFSGLITCGHCGRALVGEIKKGRYVYYHCTGHRGKFREPYTREEVLERKFTSLC